ncbi:MAG: 16S rRNA (cytosine(1402)-N(4))-methyltransferase RsmH [Nitrospirae bacterium]|nr:16S rRNA (cytosine(1402)-N(4))-methyltransferase RsmH [Nitrospirota bacterium]MCL5421263.1 16S rRNA (cytosine(1402)-N(4))-methyltransferase RsmH [Nitrospirota bacterium]
MIAHPPVMVREAMGMLEPGPGGIYVDATVGLGGHAEKILKLIGPEGRLIGIDRDEEALKMAVQRLNDSRVVLKKGRFSELEDLVRETGTEEVDGILFDFGVSMMQFKDLSRGFSFSSDERLDMRMDRSQRLRAEDVVNTYPEGELERILREYGQERLAHKIARAIRIYRAKKRITTCRELAEIVSAVYRGRGRHHPATRTFQALRIAVNDEIREIHKGLEAAAGLLRRGGRLCAISYHSLEDREVKNFMRNADRAGQMRILTKKPLIPSHDEIRKNPSARSAKLRGAERL